MKRKGLTIGAMLAWACVAPLDADIACDNDCGRRALPLPEAPPELARPPGPRTLVVTAEGQPRLQIELARLRTAGPVVALGIAYAPGFAATWTGAGGAPLLGDGWALTFPCLAAAGDVEEAPRVVTLIHEGVERIEFRRRVDGCSYASLRAAALRLQRDGEDRYELSDQWGNVVVCAGFTSRWPAPQRGKPLAYANTYFEDARGVTFQWSDTGLLRDIVDAAGRVWRFVYAHEKLSEVLVVRRDGMPLSRVGLRYGSRSDDSLAPADGLVAVTHTLPGDTMHAAAHVFRYHTQGVGAGLLGRALGPDAVADLGGVEASLRAADADTDRYACETFVYRRRDSSPCVVVSAYRGARCGTCPETGWFLIDYEYNQDPSDAATWAVQVTQRNPEGSTTMADYNCHGQLLNWVRVGAAAEGVAQEFVSYRYDAAGHLARIVYPAPSLVYDSHRHEGVPRTGWSDGLVQGFEYDAHGRLTAEVIGATSMLFTGAKDGWVTLRTYGYEDDIPWAAAIHEYPGMGQVPVATLSRHEFQGARLVRRVEQLPAVPESQNGSGVPAVRTQCFDPQTGALIRLIDGNGHAADYAYDDETGVLVRATTAAGVTRWFVDPWGQIEAVEFPDGVREVQHRAWLEPGRIATLTYRIADPAVVGPVAIVVRDLAGRVVASGTAAPAAGLTPEEALLGHGGGLADTWRGQVSRRDERLYRGGRLVALVEWSDESPALTRYAYDEAGRLASIVGPDGTIVSYGYDGLGRLVRVWEGREGSSTPHTLKERRSYDGLGRLTTVRAYREDPGAEGERTGAVTEYTYDWRGRVLEERRPDGEGAACAAFRRVYDNLDRLRELQARPRGGVRFATVHVWDHDTRGRVWREATVNIENPTLRQYTRYWHDAEHGRRKTLMPGGAFKKELRDEADRLVAVYVGIDPRDDARGETYDEAVSAHGLADDTILEEEHYRYDAGGRETLLTHRMQPPPDAVPARANVRQAAVWYDSLGRIAHTVVRGGSEWQVRPDEVPVGGPFLLRTDTSYDALGRVREVRYADGRSVRREYDARDRVTATMELSAGDDEIYVRTEYRYDDAGRVVSELALFSGTEEVRETAYEWGVDAEREFASAFASGRLLAEIRHPDPVTGLAGTRPQDRENFAYDAQGRCVRHRAPADADGSAVVHEYTYDDMGRVLADSVSTVASSSDTAIRCVTHAYDGWGRLARVSARAGPQAESAVRNEVAWEYDGFGQVTSVRQAHDGVCDAGTPAVRCVWSDGGSGDGVRRLTRLLHPTADGEEIALDYHYAGKDSEPADRAFGRARRITAGFLGGRSVASYSYQGIATAVARETSTAWAGFTLRQEYTFDDVGRVGSTTTVLAWGDVPLLPIAGVGYAYDEGGRITEEFDAAPGRRGGRDRIRRYDGMGRLALWAEGDHAQGVLGNARAVERWRLSGSGNWEEYAHNGVAEGRTHDRRDALCALDGVLCAHDGAGNLTEAAGMRAVYDAWNRLVAFEAGGVQCRIARDGLGRPVRETVSENGTATSTRDLYYRHPWQLATMIERTGARELREDYVWGLTHEDELILTHRRSGARRETIYYVQDALWNVTAALGEIGLPRERYTYSPYGAVRVWDGAFQRERGESATGTGILFQGRRLHGPLGLGVYDFRYRAYRPRLGRFLQRDPARIPYAHNLYAAPFGASFLDPYGLRPLLRNCWTAEVPIVDASGGLGLVLSGDLALRTTVCDCCGRQNVWIPRGWVETGLSGGVAAGFGIAVRIDTGGLSIGFRFELARARLLECSGSVISDACSNTLSPCVVCTRGLAFGVPIADLDLGIAGVRGAAQILVEATIAFCMVNEKSDVTFSLCYGWEAWVELRIFWLRRVLTYAGRKACVQAKL